MPWRDGSVEDWEVARSLYANGKVRHGLFFAHLAVEKLLKAIVCLHSCDLAPPTHNLVRLAAMTSLVLTQQQIDLLAEINSFNYCGTLPGYGDIAPTGR